MYELECVGGRWCKKYIYWKLMNGPPLLLSVAQTTLRANVRWQKKQVTLPNKRTGTLYSSLTGQSTRLSVSSFAFDYRPEYMIYHSFSCMSLDICISASFSRTCNSESEFKELKVTEMNVRWKGNVDIINYVQGRATAPYANLLYISANVYVYHIIFSVLLAKVHCGQVPRRYVLH